MKKETKQTAIIEALSSCGGYSFFGAFCTGGMRTLNSDELTRLLALAITDPEIIKKTKDHAEIIDFALFHFQEGEYGAVTLFNEEEMGIARMLINNGCPVLLPSDDDLLAVRVMLRNTSEYYKKKASYSFRRKEASHHIAKAHIRKRVFAKCNFVCCACGSENDLTIDHVVAVANGGGDEDSNLQLLCRKCNSSKGAR